MSYTVPVIIILVFDIHIYKYSYKTLLFKVVRAERRGSLKFKLADGGAQFDFRLVQSFDQIK